MKKITTLFLIAISLLLSACIESDKPLMPYKDWKQVTPIKGNYYVMRESFRTDAHAFTAQQTPILLKLNPDKTYSVLGHSDFDDIENIKLFGKSTQKSGVAQTFIAQAKMRSKTQNYVYFTLTAYSDESTKILHTRFTTTQTKCNKLIPDLYDMLRSEKIFANRTDGKCFLDNSSALVVFAEGGNKIWTSIEEKFFELQLDKPIVASKLEDKLLINPLNKVSETCYKTAAKEYLGPGFENAPTNILGSHLRVIAKTNRANASLETALAVEATGDKLQNYAWITYWDETAVAPRQHLGCEPHQFIKVLALLPESNVIDQNKLQPDINKVRKICREENTTQECGTIDEVIAVYQQQGLKILLQGTQIFRFPDSTFGYGGILTVMGSEGDSNKMVVLTSYRGSGVGSGITRVLYVTDDI